MENHDSEQHPTKEELAALELYHQLINLSPDNGDIALRLTLRLPNGHYVGDVLLSTEDVERMTDSAMGARMVSASEDRLSEYGEQAAGPLPLAEDDLTDTDVGDVFSGFATLLGSEDGEL